MFRDASLCVLSLYRLVSYATYSWLLILHVESKVRFPRAKSSNAVITLLLKFRVHKSRHVYCCAQCLYGHRRVNIGPFYRSRSNQISGFKRTIIVLH